MDKKVCFAFDYVFPNFNLPNALNPEIGLLNYIASRYNNDIDYGTYTENNVNIFNNFFSGSFGKNQNSVSGFIFDADVYHNKINREYYSVYSAVKQYKKFLYPIKPNPNFFDFCGDVDYDESTDKITIKGNQFWRFISKKAMEQIKRRNAIIIIDYSNEPFVHRLHYKSLDESLKFSGIHKDSIYILVNSFNAKESYEEKVPEEERNFNILNVPFCLEHSSYHYQSSINLKHNVAMTMDDFNNSRNVKRNNHFLMKIKGLRKHRLKILSRMIDDDLINMGDWSFSGYKGYSKEPDFINAMLDENVKNIEKVNQVIDNGPYNLQYEQNLNFDDINAWQNENYSPNVNSYFDICFESFFFEHDGLLSLTEKVFKPIINFQPFLFVTTKGILKLLKELGFKTFSPFIDESYDEEEDSSKRLSMIYDEIKKLCSLSKDEIHNWYWQMEDILIHNHQHLLSIHKNRMISEDTFEYLTQKLHGNI